MTRFALFAVTCAVCVAPTASLCPSAAFATNTIPATLFSPVLLSVAAPSSSTTSPAIAWMRNSDSALFLQLYYVQPSPATGTTYENIASLIGSPNVATCVHNGMGWRLGFFRAVRLLLNGATNAGGPAADIASLDMTFFEECAPSSNAATSGWCTGESMGYGLAAGCTPSRNVNVNPAYASVDLAGTGFSLSSLSVSCRGSGATCTSSLAGHPAPFYDATGDGWCGYGVISMDAVQAASQEYTNWWVRLTETAFLAAPFPNTVGPSLSSSTTSTTSWASATSNVYVWTCTNGLVGGPFYLSNSDSGWAWSGGSAPLCVSPSPTATPAPSASSSASPSASGIASTSTSVTASPSNNPSASAIATLSATASYVPCAAGFVRLGRDAACTPCAAGTAAQANAASCTPCASGLWSSSGFAACIPCPPGTFSDTSGSSCSLCPAGTFGSSAGLSSADCSGPCTSCKAGSTAPSTLSCSPDESGRAIPASLGLEVMLTENLLNSRGVDLLLAPQALCSRLAGAVCDDSSAIVGADGITRFVAGPTASFNVEVAEMLTCSA